MDAEEFLRKLGEMENETKLLIKHEQSFIKQLSSSLFIITIENREIVREMGCKAEEYIKELSEKAAEEVLGWLDHALELVSLNIIVNGKYKVPAIQTKQEAEIKLHEEMKFIPQEDEEDRAYYSEIFWESYYSELKEASFIHAIFNEMKKVLVDYYQDDIIALDSMYLKDLDSNIYIAARNTFVEAVYELEGGIHAL